MTQSKVDVPEIMRIAALSTKNERQAHQDWMFAILKKCSTINYKDQDGVFRLLDLSDYIEPETVKFETDEDGFRPYTFGPIWSYRKVSGSLRIAELESIYVAAYIDKESDGILGVRYAVEHGKSFTGFDNLSEALLFARLNRGDQERDL